MEYGGSKRAAMFRSQGGIGGSEISTPRCSLSSFPKLFIKRALSVTGHFNLFI